MEANKITYCEVNDERWLSNEDFIGETWRNVVGYEGIYVVSNYGRIKRLPLGKQWPYRKTHNNIRKVRKNNQGYYVVNLSRENEVKWILVHRIVAMAFIPNPQNLPQVNHKDENKLNNVVDNLEWCDQRYNNLYGTARYRQNKTRHKNDPNNEKWKAAGMKNAKQIAAYNGNGVLVQVYPSVSEAANACNYHISSIIRQCKGKTKSRRNMYFRYYYEVQ